MTLHVRSHESNVIMISVQADLALCCQVLMCFLLLQGHALFVRQAGGYLPCPQLDFTGGFNGFLGAAYGLGDSTIEEVYGSPFGKSAMFCSIPQLCFQPAAWGLKPGVIVEDRHLGHHNLRLLVANAFGAVQSGNWLSSPLLSLNCTVFESYSV